MNIWKTDTRTDKLGECTANNRTKCKEQTFSENKYNSKIHCKHKCISSRKNFAVFPSQSIRYNIIKIYRVH